MKLLSVSAIAAMDGGGGNQSVTENPRPLPDEVALQIARGLEMLGRHNTTRSTIADFDAAMYDQYPRGTRPENPPSYLAFRSIRTGRGQAGIAVDPVGPVKHLETAQILVHLDEIEKKESAKPVQESQPKTVQG